MPNTTEHAADFPRSFTDFAIGGIDVVMAAQLMRVPVFVGAASDRDGLEAHGAAELDPEMSEAAVGTNEFD